MVGNLQQGPKEVVTSCELQQLHDGFLQLPVAISAAGSGRRQILANSNYCRQFPSSSNDRFRRLTKAVKNEMQERVRKEKLKLQK
jgi:hypothetical protein